MFAAQNCLGFLRRYSAKIDKLPGIPFRQLTMWFPEYHFHLVSSFAVPLFSIDVIKKTQYKPIYRSALRLSVWHFDFFNFSVFETNHTGVFALWTK